MPTKRILLVVTVLAVVSLACGITNPLQGLLGGGGGSSNLWADVPRMDGLDDSSQAMPFAMRMFLQFVVGQALSDAGGGDMDIITFTTTRTAADVQAFYSADRMHFEDWDTENDTNCFNGSEQGLDGLVCVFSKQEGTGEALLLIVASPGDNDQTNVYFVRVQGNE
ncbi:MAG: hypothetical protein KIS88_08335 [Anaerolineales bacterium]|nr:hypothetical protein [Anaerolineales bacterium]